LRDQGLRFRGFDLPEPVLAKMREDGGDPLDLMSWDAFEARNPATFRGMYQLWAEKPQSTRRSDGTV
jgi:hypothetical protein